MNTTEILRLMCQKELADVDIKAICKNRGFNEPEAKSRSFFENFLLSDIGVEEILSKLETKELIILHLLAFISKPVEISFFERIYQWTYRALSKNYQSLFKQIKETFIRKGIIFFAESKAIFKSSKTERFLFVFPDIFKKFLPLPFKIYMYDNLKSLHKDLVIRNKLSEIIYKESLTNQSILNNKYELNIAADGCLKIGKVNFKSELLKEWQLENLKIDCNVCFPVNNTNKSYYISPITVLNYSLSLIKDDEFINSEELSNFINTFCFDIAPINIEKIYQSGCKWGYLIKHTERNQTYYRLAQENMGKDIPYNIYLQRTNDSGMIIDLRIIPLRSLDILSNISKFKLIDSKLCSFPNYIKLGRFIKLYEKEPLIFWLKENINSFKELIERLESEWGKRIVHTNLLFAHIKDLSLKVLLQKTFSNSDNVKFLPKDFIAFPKDFLKEIESTVNYAGYIIKNLE